MDADDDLEVPGFPKKEYLTAGLYSNSSEAASPFVDVPKSTLPLPINFGEWYMDQESEFQIPYDIALLYELKGLQEKRTPPSYIKLRSNVFVERNRRHDYNPPQCHCVKPADGGPGCLEDCINRATFIECSTKNCPCGDQCTNTAFQKKKGVKELEVFYASARGFGLRTKVPIGKGNLVTEYRGEVISQEMSLERMATIYQDSKHYYFLDYSNGEILDGGVKGNDARFVVRSSYSNKSS